MGKQLPAARAQKEASSMAAGNKPKYYLVEASVLPEIFAKVI